MASPKSKNPVGRPTEYQDAYVDQVFKLALLGAKETEVADFFGVSQQTITTWKSAHPEFLAAMRDGKEKADTEIASSLYHRAKGYSHEAVKIFMPAGASEPVYAPYTEHFPPDTAAASLWLRNRQPRRWRDKQDLEVFGKDGAALAFTLMVPPKEEKPDAAVSPVAADSPAK